MSDVQIHRPTLIAVSRLRPHPRNYRTHPQDQREHLIQSMREHGFYRNVVVAADLTILAGHGVVEAAIEAGIEKVLAVKLDIPPDHPKALKLLAADNEVGRLAAIDDRRLTELLREIGSVDVDGLLGTGYSQERLANLLFVTRPMNEIGTMDEAAHWVGLPEYDQEATKKAARIIVFFEDPDLREAFMEKIGATVIQAKNGNVWSIWWPQRERERPSELRFERAEAE